MLEELFQIYKEHGEQEVTIDLLTEETSKRAEICHCEFSEEKGVTIDIFLKVSSH